MNRLWSELDKQRPSSFRPLYRSQIAGLLAALLFLRWLDQDEREREAVASFDDKRYEPRLPAHLRWSNWSRLRGPELRRLLTYDLPNKIKPAPDYLDPEDLDTLADLFPHMGREANHLLALEARFHHLATVLEVDLGESTFLLDLMVDYVSELDLSNPSGRDVASRLIDEVVLWAVEENKSSGEHYTPQGVVDLMIELADPQPGNRIYDPCFGSGGLLVACAVRLRDHAKLLPLRAWNDLRTNSLFGVEINPLWYIIGMTRLVLAGIPEPRLEMGDALERSSQRLPASEKFDVIVACPPWGGMPDKHGRIHPASTSRFRSKDSENLFLQHVAESLRPGGKAVVAVPEGTLFRPGSDRQVRQWLLEDFRVDGVISLPPGTFAPFTNIKSNLLVFRRDRPAKKVRFCVVHSLTGAERRPSSESELPTEVARRFRKGEETKDLWETPIKDLARREWELIAKSSGVDELQQLLDAIGEADESIEIKDLGNIADVFAGMSYDKRTTVENPNGHGNAVGLVRVSDVQDGRIGQPTLFLNDAANVTNDDRLRLQAGDILTSVSGSIGKIAIVQSTPTPIVASKSVVVIRPKPGTSSSYLLALLQSKSYQSWLSGHARGSTIQHLSVKTLRGLHIPLPSLPLQERVSSACETGRGEALSVLLELITGSRRDPIVEWLESAKPVRAILDHGMVIQGVNQMAWLEHLAVSCMRARNRIVHLSDSPLDSRLAAWFVNFSGALEGLQGLTRIPEGAAELSILEGALAGITKASRLLEDRSQPANTAALALMRQVEKIVIDRREELLANVKVLAAIDPEVIPSGRSSEVILKLRNQSPLPLRRFSVRTEPSVGSLNVPFFKEGEELTVPLAIPASESPGFYDFRVHWSGTKLDGNTGILDDISLRIEVRAESKIAGTNIDDLGKSPYIVGGPVDRQEMLFGRDDVIDRIKRQLSTSQRANVILLEGNRRTGKSSILERLKSPGQLPDWVPIVCSFQGGEGAEGLAGLHTREIFRLMAREIGWQAFDAGIQTWFPDVEPPDANKNFKLQFTKALDVAFATERPFEVFELYLQDAIKACLPRRPLLMLDEFDKLQEGIDSGITSPQVPENIRYLVHTYPGFAAILTGSRRLKRLREEYWSALFGLGHRIGISALPLDAARLLVTQPVEGRLVYVDEARDRLVELCACHPFLVQQLCNRVFEDAVLNRVRTITVSTVEAAAQELLVDNEHFRTLWGYAGTDRRRVLLALIERLAGDPDPVTFSLLETKQEELGIPIPPDERLGDDIDFLRELELIDIDSASNIVAYRLAVPLLGEWIKSNVDFDDLRQKAVKEGQAKLK